MTHLLAFPVQEILCPFVWKVQFSIIEFPSNHQELEYQEWFWQHCQKRIPIDQWHYYMNAKVRHRNKGLFIADPVIRFFSNNDVLVAHCPASLVRIVEMRKCGFTLRAFWSEFAVRSRFEYGTKCDYRTPTRDITRIFDCTAQSKIERVYLTSENCLDRGRYDSEASGTHCQVYPAASRSCLLWSLVVDCAAKSLWTSKELKRMRWIVWEHSRLGNPRWFWKLK